MRLTPLVLCLSMVSLGASSLFAEGPEIQILERSLNLQLPSASAMSTTKDGFTVVGDDSPFLFQLDKHFNITSKTVLKDYPVDANGRIPKSIKPDFEAMTDFSYKGESWQLIIGSGSKSVRKLAVLRSKDGAKHIEKNMATFYAQLAAAAGFPAGTLVNLEGLAFTGGHFIFMNRVNSGGNVIFKVKKKDLFDYLTGQTPAVADIKTCKVHLPSLEGNEAGLSGADYLPESGTLLFTSSVEVTNDPIRDGEILGSYIGCIDLEDLKDGMDLSRHMTLVTQGGAPLITKIETITAVRAEDDEMIEVAVASDMDNGTSEFFRMILRRKD